MPGLNEIIAASKAHPKKYAAMKKAVGAKVILAAHIAKVPSMQRVHMSYQHFEPNRRRDPSNFCSGAQKMIEDALIKVGVIPNDGWNNIASFDHRWQVSKNKPGVCVFIAEAEDEGT